MELLLDLPRRVLVVASAFWPLVVLAGLGLLIQIVIVVWRRVVYSNVVRDWRLVDASLMETRSVSESRVGRDGDRHCEVHYAGRVRFDDRVEFMRVPGRWHRMVGKAGNMRHGIVRTCDGVSVKVLVDPDNPSNVVAPGDMETVVGPRGCLWQLGFAMTLFGVMAFLIAFLSMSSFV